MDEFNSVGVEDLGMDGMVDYLEFGIMRMDSNMRGTF